MTNMNGLVVMEIEFIKKCKPNLNKAYDAINNMSDSEFNEYIRGERELLNS